MYLHPPDGPPDHHSRWTSFAARCLLWWPMAMGAVWWPMLIHAWFTVYPQYTGMEVMAAMACNATAYGLAFYLAVALPVYRTARRRRPWRLIPVVTSTIYIATGSMLSWSFTVAFTIVVAAMLVSELSTGTRFHRQLKLRRDWIADRLAEHRSERRRATYSDDWETRTTADK